MVFPREVLNAVKWRDTMDISRCTVTYLHRGAENDSRSVRGDEIIELGRSFFRVRGSMIPYHRIRLITYEGEVLYKDEG